MNNYKHCLLPFFVPISINNSVAYTVGNYLISTFTSTCTTALLLYHFNSHLHSCTICY